MKDKIFQYVKDLVALQSTTHSNKELEGEEYFNRFFSSIPYLKKHPEYYGLFEIKDDPLGRKVPYAFLKGNKPDTVVMSGHYDVVSTEVYGLAEPWAYTLEGTELEEKLATMDLTDRERADLASGEWLWGRGTADMKGGLGMHMALFEEYAKQAEAGTLEGSILFMTVCDEESYSAGMRAGAEVLKKFKDEYGLKYKLLIDPEPTAEAEGGTQVMSLGSVGKCLPVVVVQGKVAHVGFCYNGFSPLNLIAGIYQRTNGSLEFSDTYKGEATVPPTWGNMRDMKMQYDASLPYRAYGYFTVLSFDSTPEDTLAKLKKISEEVFEEEVAKLNANYQKYKTMSKFETRDRLHYDTCVMSFNELCDMLKERDGAKFDAAYEKIYASILEKTASGELNYPDATVKFIESVLDYADLQQPIVILGFAPPYYMPVHSDKIKGKEGYGTKAYELVKKLSEEKYNQKVDYENYFMGISDASYSAMTDPFDYEKFSKNTPLWGKAYSMNFEAIEDIAIPSIIYGPIGLGYHQRAERVNKRMLFEVVPNVTRELIQYMWNL